MSGKPTRRGYIAGVGAVVTAALAGCIETSDSNNSCGNKNKANDKGIRDGSNYLEVLRGQVDDFGVDRQQGTAVTELESTENGFTVTTDDGEHTASYVVLATGANRDLAETLGCAFTDEDVVEVDVTMETSIEEVFGSLVE